MNRQSSTFAFVCLGVGVAISLAACTPGSTGSGATSAPTEVPSGSASGSASASASASPSGSFTPGGSAECLVGRWKVNLAHLAAEEERISRTGFAATASGSVVINFSPTVMSPTYALTLKSSKTTSQGITVMTKVVYTGTASAEYTTAGNTVQTSLPVNFVVGRITTYVNGRSTGTRPIPTGGAGTFGFNNIQFSCAPDALTLLSTAGITWQATRFTG